jgi:uncharacterized membrane protein YhaH (DUF805 family)
MAWLELYLSCHGRISRRQYWLASLPLIGAQILIELLIASEIEPVLATLLSLAVAIPGLVITIKRLHDRGRNGWFASIAAIPLLGATWLLIEAGLLPGTRGPNRFGPDPLEAAGAGSATSAAAPI